MVHTVVRVVRAPESSAEMAPCGCFGMIFETPTRGSRGAIVQRTCGLGNHLLKVGHPLKHIRTTQQTQPRFKPQTWQ